MPVLVSPNSPALPTVPAAWKAGAKPGQIVGKLVGQAAAPAPTRPSTGALRFVRKTGSDTNGGSSASLTPDSQGTDGVTNGTTLFTAATGTFTSADVNKLIMIGTKARYRIVAVAGLTSITLSGSPTAGSGLTWKVGGAVQTISSLLSTAAGNSPVGTILGGDTVYIGAGVYREVNPTLPTPTFELVIEGDVTGFWTGDRGMVQWSAFLTDDRTAPSGTAMLQFASKSNFTFNNIFFVGGTAAVISPSAATQNLTFNRCGFQQTSSAVLSDTAIPFGTYRNVQFNGCYFSVEQTTMIALAGVTGGGGHWDIGYVLRNCFVNGSGAAVFLSVNISGSLVGRPGGVKLLNSTLVGLSTAFVVVNGSTAIPNVVYGCFMRGCSTGLSAGSFGQIVEAGNFISASTPRTSVGVGAGSYPGGANLLNSIAVLSHFGQESIWGAMPRHVGEPMVGSPLLGFGWETGGSDILGRPRPAGEYSAARAGPAVGALQRGNTATADATPIGGGTTPIQITGPGFEDFYVPVPASAITVSCSVRYTGSPAVLSVLANPTIGVQGVSVVEPEGVPNVVHTLSLPAFTPTAGGNMVIIRIYNPDPSGSSVLEIDDFSVTSA
jgi:hypothetical protein